MLSLKRLGYVLLMVIGICGIFILYNMNENDNKIVTIKSKEVEEKDIIYGESISKSEEVHFYVVGDEEKDIYRDIYGNVCRLMDDLKLSWSKLDRIEAEELSNSKAVFIFCDDIVNSYVDLRLLTEFIEKGGKVILAAGIAEGYEDSYLTPVVGIIEKTVKVNYQQFRFVEGFFPLQEELMTYDGYNASMWLNVRNDAEVYVEDADKKVPIIYSYPYGKGETLVINATFLNDSRCMGFLTAGIGCVIEDFVYPVLGVECVFLDNFPIVTYVDDAVCMKLYGRNTEAFVRDVVWPVFQGIAVRNEIQYTSSVLSVTTEKDAFPAISESLFSTLGKSALQYDGEMAFAADCFNDSGLYRNDIFINNFEKTFQNYEIGTLVMISDEPIQESIDTLGKDIHAVRGKLYAEKAEDRMAFLDNYYVFPEATKGISLDNGNMMAIASVLTSHGIVSHTFDVNRLITIDESNPSWDTDKVALAEFEKRIFIPTDFLQKATLTDTKSALESYLGLEYTWEKTENTIEISANKIVQGQPFYVRTEKKILKAEGAEFEKLENNYYLLRLNSCKAVLTLE